MEDGKARELSDWAGGRFADDGPLIHEQLRAPVYDAALTCEGGKTARRRAQREPLASSRLWPCKIQNPAFD